jgi:GTP pyrophosphokinase
MDLPHAAPPELATANSGATAITSTDSGRNLEAAVPAPTPLSPEDSQRRTAPATAPGKALPIATPIVAITDLAEPTGTLETAAPPPIATPSLRSAVYLPNFPTAVTSKIDADFDILLATVHTNRPGDDLDVIRSAWQFCMSQHANQKRASGDPYVIHPLEVGQILAEMKMDSTAIAAGLLHDAVEDTDVSTAEISRRFGEQVAHIVEGVTKLDRIKFANKEDHQAENIRKMLLAMVSDIRVVLIKMADRLHNMRTLGALRPDKQYRIAKETLDIYAPLAHRLGMGKLRGEFEDLAFRYVDPDRYLKLAQDVELALNRGGDEFLENIVARFNLELTRHGLPGRVESRIKRLYSINQKLVTNTAEGGDDDISQVHDLFAIRVITQTVQDCYAILGLLHSIWRPVPGRIKDFIAMPRPNLYQSLHTTLVAEGGYQFEVQIRTDEMHRIAEDGIAAHWKYKANESVSAKDEQRLAWVRQLMEWQKEMTDPNEFMSTLKIDLYPEEVYTFTPKGKVVVLPKDASPIDFAYTIHTEVGHTTTGAKVNGRIVPLKHRLRNGDIVEITTQAGHTPSRDWLSFVKSSRARNKIKHWLNEHQRERAIEIGRKLLEREARKFKVSLHKLADTDYDRVANDYGLGAGQDLLSAIGFGKYSARQALNKLAPGSTTLAGQAAAAETETSNQKLETGVSGPGNTMATMSDAVKRVYFGKGSDSLQVEGQGDLLVYRARCCNPIRGEEIVGYVTRGKGVAVHARSCPNVQNLLYESDRRIHVEWAPLEPEAKPALGPDGKPLIGKDGKPVFGHAGTAGATPKPTRYPVRLIVLCDERSGMLKELTAIISDDDTNIRSVSSSANDDGTTATIDFVVETLDLRHLNKLTVDMRRVPGVREVQRVSKI